MTYTPDLQLDGIRAVLIDLDGTLVDTAGDFAVALNAMLADLGAAPVSTERLMTFVGKGTANLVRKTLAERFPADDIDTLFERAQDKYEAVYTSVNGANTALYPEVREGLAALRAAGLPVACITNKQHRFAVALLAHYDLSEHFDLVYGGDSWPKRKPDPMPLVKACEVFGVSPAQAVLVGDSGNDAQAARAAGCRSLTVPYGYNHGESVQTIDTDGIVGSILGAARAILPRATPVLAS
ncbi:phosphoglycolate phosphatase [Pandoraea terrigena]|uniref:Phosphoglycolate phosphatase n=1 Tax=Pandoraea terrigena TaxID=2508292 RepID=A0A5E4WB83_9BURK|nr:phosphoglycolate phosphatase [Pandoraea terrigena]VVE22012.1 phosphoglycolate phosphatase [Pandoraea terrigena]